jgi:hypothetical protein
MEDEMSKRHILVETPELRGSSGQFGALVLANGGEISTRFCVGDHRSVANADFYKDKQAGWIQLDPETILTLIWNLWALRKDMIEEAENGEG